MKTILAVGLFLLAGAARADEGLILTWESCPDASPVSDQAFDGPHAYVLSVGLTGSGRTITSYELDLAVVSFYVNCARGTFPPAWEFEPGGCNQDGMSIATLGEPGCDAVSAGGGVTFATYDVHPGFSGARRVRVGVGLAAPVTLDPAKIYRLAKITFDHSQSVTGLSGVGTCGQADDPMCIHLERATFTESGSEGQWPAGGFVDWVGQVSGGACLCDPAKPATWGDLKARYR